MTIRKKTSAPASADDRTGRHQAAHPVHDQMLEWNNGPFDPTTVDCETINRRLLDIKL